MIMHVRRLVHAGLELEHDELSILIDPGKYCFQGGHPLAQWEPEDFAPDILLFTHAHADHFLPEATATMFERAHPHILGSREVVEALSGLGISATHTPPGYVATLDPVKVQAVPADHRRPGETVGYVITWGGLTLYHCGDTHYMTEKPQADIVFVPIGDLAYTMDPAEAARFTREIAPRWAVPIHYESPKMSVTPQEFVVAMEGSGIEVKVLEVGEAWTPTLHGG
jgi:L-ascorbate metabolism protein UlaG (beta-lactamase superfamily)